MSSFEHRVGSGDRFGSSMRMCIYWRLRLRVSANHKAVGLKHAANIEPMKNLLQHVKNQTNIWGKVEHVFVTCPWPMSSWVCPTTRWWWDTPENQPPWHINVAHLPVYEFRTSFTALSAWSHILRCLSPNFDVPTFLQGYHIIIYIYILNIYIIYIIYI